MIKFQGKVLTLKSPARVYVDTGWNNSMGTYYPHITAIYFQDGIVTKEFFTLGEWSPNEVERSLEYDIDNKQLFELQLKEKQDRDIIESQVVRLGKEVTVISGRKLPIGFTGRVFWLGNSGYGESVGIETVKGERKFTALRNVKVS